MLDPATGGALPHTALAARDGRISFLGDDREARALAGPGTTVVDLRGAVVTAGLTDGHLHPVSGAERTMGVDLSGCRDPDAVRGALAEAVRTLPPGGRLRGWGLDPNAFGTAPGTAALGPVLDGVPALIDLFDAHCPTGLLPEDAGCALVEAVAPRPAEVLYAMAAGEAGRGHPAPAAAHRALVPAGGGRRRRRRPRPAPGHRRRPVASGRGETLHGWHDRQRHRLAGEAPTATASRPTPTGPTRSATPRSSPPCSGPVCRRPRMRSATRRCAMSSTPW
ncbi:amidohydrolase family protein [Streptomyces lasalocidi]